LFGLLDIGRGLHGLSLSRPPVIEKVDVLSSKLPGERQEGLKAA
jgi:hypothetical protein